MKIGFSLPNIGPIGTVESITKVAQRAEALGYSSLWTIDRLLWPLNLQKPYPGTPDGSLPEIYKRVLDPLEALTYVAAQTKKIRLGTSVLDMPYYNPVVLARSLTTLDVLSNGRLSVGLGLGWNKDEMDATNADITKRGAVAEEFLPLLKAIWTTNPVEFHRQVFQRPKVLHQSQASAETPSPDCPWSICPGSTPAVGEARGRLESSVPSCACYVGDVRQHQKNGGRSGS
jgi:alkanesulfonate monooxygenase SsuD/methylene tetrahydromethanopterin reductase-like flavin-dependent oxidoreductase (luciferase family)